MNFTVYSKEITSKLAIAAPKTKNIITNHKKTIINWSEALNKKKYNCINQNTGLLNGQCRAENIIYQASLNSNKLDYDEKYYKGSCETTFEKRFVNHKKWVVKHVRLHWNSWQWNYYDMCESCRNTELPEEKNSI